MTEPHSRSVMSDERRYRLRCVDAGWVAGWTMGWGVSGFWWMNPYIALALTLGGFVLGITARVATR